MKFYYYTLAVMLLAQSVGAQSLWRNSATTNRTPWVVSGSTNIVGTITNPIVTTGSVSSTGGFTSAGSNYFGTVQSTNILDPSNVKYWGAKGDGVTDDTVAIQAAIDYLSDTNKITPVRITLDGNHVISNTITLFRKSGELSGSGWGSETATGKSSTLIWRGPENIPMVKIWQCAGATIRDLRIVGNTTNKPSSAINFLEGTNDIFPNANCVIENVWIGEMFGIAGNSGEQFDCGILMNGEDSNNQHHAIKNLVIYGAGDGIRIDGLQYGTTYIDGFYCSATTNGIDTKAPIQLNNSMFVNSHVGLLIHYGGYVWANSLYSQGVGRLAHFDNNSFGLSVRGGISLIIATNLSSDRVFISNTNDDRSVVSFSDYVFQTSGSFSSGLPLLKFAAAANAKVISFERCEGLAATNFVISTATEGDPTRSGHIVFTGAAGQGGYGFRYNTGYGSTAFTGTPENGHWDLAMPGFITGSIAVGNTGDSSTVTIRNEPNVSGKPSGIVFSSAVGTNQFQNKWNLVSSGEAENYPDNGIGSNLQLWNIINGTTSNLLWKVDRLTGLMTFSNAVAFSNTAVADFAGNGRFAASSGNPAAIGNAGGAAYFGSSTSGWGFGLTGDGGSTFRLFVDGAGKIGIGSTTPQSKLDVTGDIRASTTITATNGFFLPTQTAPPVVAGGGTLWNSNSVLYWVTATKTNMVSDGR